MCPPGCLASQAGPTPHHCLCPSPVGAIRVGEQAAGGPQQMGEPAHCTPAAPPASSSGSSPKLADRGTPSVAGLPLSPLLLSATGSPLSTVTTAMPSAVRGPLIEPGTSTPHHHQGTSCHRAAHPASSGPFAMGCLGCLQLLHGCYSHGTPLPLLPGMAAVAVPGLNLAALPQLAPAY